LRPSRRAGSQDRYVVLGLGNLRLLLPQRQVYTIEPALDVERSEETDERRISIDGASWPVHCLSEDLRPMREVPSTRRICLLLRTTTGLLGLLCDRVALYGGGGEIQVLPVPGCMLTPDSPLRGLVLQGEEVLCLTCAEDLVACVDPT
jgi:hypothetical protein